MLPGAQMNLSLQHRLAKAGLNPAVQAFVISESLFWSSWNLIAPIFAVFVVSEIPGATVSQAAFGLTVYFIVRVFVELWVSRRAGSLSSAQRAVIDVLGISIVSLAYLAIALVPTYNMVIVFYILAGLGFGIASPVKYALFTRALEKETEVSVWGIYDVAILASMAVATMAGGLIAEWYGFKTLFLMAAAINALGALPYLFFIRWWRTSGR